MAQAPSLRENADGSVTLRLYEPIDSWGEFWGISAKEFTETLDQVPDTVPEIRLLINSPGGEVYEGLAILNALRAHPARVVAIVEGIAASAASFIAAGVDELVMMHNSELFIHNAWGWAMGNAAEMTLAAADLSRIDMNLASIYAAKAGNSAEDWLPAMGADTFYSADEAVAAGLADRIEGEGDAAAARARFDLSTFSARMPRAVAQLPASEPVALDTEEQNMDFRALLIEKLGLAADATDDEIVAALDAVIAEAADENASAQLSVEDVAARLPKGLATIDEGVLASLQSDAAAGRQALAAQAQARREGIIANALREGRIAPASVETWSAQLEDNEEGTSKLLASLPTNTVPVTEIGGVAESSADDAHYNAIFPTAKKEA